LEVPKSMLIMKMMHHCLSCTLVLPMNLYVHNEPLYSEFIVLMSGAAGFAMFLGCYGDACDVDTKEGQWHMRISSNIGGIVLVFCRGLYYPTLVYRTLAMFWRGNNMKFFWGSLPIFLIFEMLNLAYCMGAIARMKKFNSDIEKVTEVKKD